MKALLTGITGFVGGHLTRHLLASGDEVVGVSQNGAWPADFSLPVTPLPGQLANDFPPSFHPSVNQ